MVITGEGSGGRAAGLRRQDARKRTEDSLQRHRTQPLRRQGGCRRLTPSQNPSQIRVGATATATSGCRRLTPTARCATHHSCGQDLRGLPAPSAPPPVPSSAYGFRVSGSPLPVHGLIDSDTGSLGHCHWRWALPNPFRRLQIETNNCCVRYHNNGDQL